MLRRSDVVPMLKRNVIWLSILLATMALLNAIWFAWSWSYFNGGKFRGAMHGKNLSIDFDRLYSPFPGFLVARNLRLRATRSGVTWELTFDSSRMFLRLLPLREKKVLFSFLHAEGGHLSFDRVADKVSPGGRPTLADDGRSESTWEVGLDNIRLTRMEELRVEGYRLQGRSSVEAAMHFEKNADFRIDRFHVNLASADASREGEKFGQLRGTEINLVLESYNNRSPNASLLDKLTAEIELNAELTNLKPLEAPLSALPYLKIASARAKAMGTIRFEKGEFVPPSKLMLKSDDFKLRFLGQEAIGEAMARWVVKDSTRFDLIFDHYGLQRKGVANPEVEGKGLHVWAESDERWGKKKVKSWRAAILVPKARIKQLAYLNAFVPQGFGFQVSGGRGTLEAELKASSQEAGDGFFRIRTENMAMNYEPVQMQGDMVANFTFEKVNLEDGEFTLKDSTISLGHVAITAKDRSADSWYGTLKIPEADLRIEEPMRFDGRVRLEGKDLRPILAVYGALKNLPSWMENALNLKNIAVDFHAKADRNRLAIDDLKASLEDIKLEGWYAREAAKPQGKLLLKYGQFNAGLGVQGDEFELKLLGAKDWYSGR